MDKKMFFKARLYFTGIVTVAIWSLLAWNYYHGGVLTHHILQQGNLPGISNWWGGLLLPLLTWFLLYRLEKRRLLDEQDTSKFLRTIYYGFGGALVFGILLSIFFTFDYSDILEYMVDGLFLLAFFVPIYRSECLLGFVIGMTFTFGAMLPTMAGCLFSLVGVVLYRVVRPMILFVATKLNLNIDRYGK